MRFSKDEPLKQWTRDCRDEYLDEFIRSEGRGNFTHNHCPSCKRAANSTLCQDPFERELGMATIRCMDCFGGELVCEDCCVRNHVQNPLHMVEVRFLWFHFSLYA
jgi:hypothetical protein